MAHSSKNLSLFPGAAGTPRYSQRSGRSERARSESARSDHSESDQASDTEKTLQTAGGRLWLAVCLHDLILDASVLAGLQEPAVIVDADDAYIAAANPAAQMLGIETGCALNAALAMADNLRIEARTTVSEQNALRSLAIWARTLTPIVSIVEPNILLLEIRGSLRLFGGVENMTGALRRQLTRRGLSARTSLAPSAHAAVWLSRHDGSDVHDRAQLPGALRNVPLGVTGWPQGLLKRLNEMGVSRIGELLRLPRDGLALRMGRKYLRELDQALGKAFEQREVSRLPEERVFTIDLPAETDDRTLLVEGCEQLFVKLMRELRSQQKQISRFTIRLFHLHQSASSEAFELLMPTCKQRHMTDLLEQRLERIVLPAPVISIELRTGELLDLHTDTPELFSDTGFSHAGHHTEDTDMLERLRERCGPKSVFGVTLVSDHRPESAWSVSKVSQTDSASQAGDTQLSPWAGERPLWLLPVPRPCDPAGLQIEFGPERIESGWWDERSVNRDYYIARHSSGERLWVYFDHRQRDWYVHGAFG